MKLQILAATAFLALVGISDVHAAYDPYVGRWLSRDPIGEPDKVLHLTSWGKLVSQATPAPSQEAEMFLGPNLYQYCGNSPTNYIDPLGLDFQSWDSCFLQCLQDNGWFELAASIFPGVPFNTTTYMGPRSKTILGSTNPNTTMASDLQTRGYLPSGARAVGRVLNPAADAYAAYASARMLGIEIGCGIKCSNSCPKK